MVRIMAERNNRREAVIKSSGNVFADLGFQDAAERQTKVRLAAALCSLIDRFEWTQVEAARRLGINQPKISALRNYRLEGFSVERLMHFLTALDQDVEIIIRDRSRSRRAGKIVVRAA
ncbi:MAG: helix-turn-helix transcriptional regulator [Bryobacteraceae bacterium]